MSDVIQLVRAPELRVPARLTSLDGIARYVLALAGRAGLGTDAAYRLRLAVDELATNVVIHGYRDGRGDGRGDGDGHGDGDSHGHGDGDGRGDGRGDGGSHGDGEIVLRGGIGTDRVWVRIEDTAPPFDPRQGCRPPETGLAPECRRVGGLGVHLALTSVDEFTYAHREGRNISTLTILFGHG